MELDEVDGTFAITFASACVPWPKKYQKNILNVRIDKNADLNTSRLKL